MVFKLQKYIILVFSVILVQDGVEASFEKNPMMDHFKGTKKGKVYLTSLVVSSLEY